MRHPHFEVPRREIFSPCPLSFSQEALWFLHQMDTEHAAYNLFAGFEMNGPFDPARIKAGLELCQQRHECLRTAIESKDGQPFQIIKPELPVPLSICDVPADTPVLQNKKMSAWLKKELYGRFDLQKPPLYRCSVFVKNPQEYILVFIFFHMICDGWSLELFFREFSAGFNACYAAHTPGLPGPSRQYADYAVWQKEQFNRGVYGNQLAYWGRTLEGVSPLDLPSDRPRPNVRTLNGAVIRLPLADPATVSALGQTARGCKSSLFIILLAAFQVLLYRYTGRDDITTGIPAANRRLPELQDVIGFFVNTLVIRGRFAPEMTFLQVLRIIRDTALHAYANQDVPFEKLVKEINPRRLLDRHPLFDVMFSMVHKTMPAMQLDGLTAKPLILDTNTAKFDLAVTVLEKDHGLDIEVRFNTDLFEAGTMGRFADLFRFLLRQIARDPEYIISKIPILDQSGREKILFTWNRTQKQYPRDETVHGLFEKQAASTPEAVALVTDEEKITYRQLNARANGLAHVLAGRGMAPATPVGVCAGRGVQAIVACLAILKAGGAYVPLDPNYPRERLSRMLEMGKMPLVLGLQRYRERLPEGQEYIFFDDHPADVQPQNSSNLSKKTSAKDLCYIVFTSGSTGTPKGVEIPHRGVVSLVKNVEYVRLDTSSTVLQLASHSFDAATFEIWAPLLNGGCCVLYPDVLPDPNLLAKILYKHSVDILFLTTALYNALIDEAPDILVHVRQLFVGGEKLSPQHITRGVVKLPGTQIYNIYGPTENTTFSSYYKVPLSFDAKSPLPIGRPLANRQMYILDRHLEPVPVQVAGELYLGGDGLARGYCRRPDLTRERFIPHPFDRTPGARLYKTGDLAKYTPDGNVHFLGRTDRQIKWHGFRIEPEEIEHVFTRHPLINQCVVVLQVTSGPQKRLLAYVVPSVPKKLPTGRLYDWLRQKLPAYMVPDQMVQVDQIPRTANQKIDYAALPMTGQKPAEMTEPENEMELQLVQIWEDLLGVHPISTRDNFFDLGGHSLLAVRLFSRLEKVFSRHLSPATLFQAPTIRSLAVVLQHQGYSGQWPSLVPIRRSGDKPPLFCIHGMGGHVVVYRELAEFLPEDQPVFGLQARGLDGTTPPLDSVEEMAQHYLNEISGFYSKGPVFLCGLCLGGLVAYETAIRFRRLGREVGFVGLIESAVPPARLMDRRRLWMYSARRWLCRIGVGVRTLILSPPSSKSAFIRDSVRRLRARLQSIIWRRSRRRTWRHEHKKLPGALQQVRETNQLAQRHYLPDAFDGEIVLFRAHRQKAGLYDKHTYGWDRIVRSVHVVEVPGDHDSVYKQPFVKELGKEIEQKLASGVVKSE